MSTISLIIIPLTGHAIVVEVLMIVIPVLGAGLFFPFFFSNVALTTNEKTSGIAFGLLISFTNLLLAASPTIIGYMNQDQKHYLDSYMF